MFVVAIFTLFPSPFKYISLHLPLTFFPSSSNTHRSVTPVFTYLRYLTAPWKNVGSRDSKVSAKDSRSSVTPTTRQLKKVVRRDWFHLVKTLLVTISNTLYWKILSWKNLFVDVVYYVTIVAIGHRLLKKFWPMVIGCVLRTAGSSIIWNYAEPLTSLELLNCYLTLAMITGRSSRRSTTGWESRSMSGESPSTRHGNSRDDIHERGIYYAIYCNGGEEKSASF